MKISITPELYEYMAHKKKDTIVVDVASSDHSDIEVTEIFYRLCDSEHRQYLVEKRGFKEAGILDRGEILGSGDVESGHENHSGAGHHHRYNRSPERVYILFPQHRLEKGETIEFFLEKKWIFHLIRGRGIKL